VGVVGVIDQFQFTWTYEAKSDWFSFKKRLDTAVFAARGLSCEILVLIEGSGLREYARTQRLGISLLREHRKNMVVAKRKSIV